MKISVSETQYQVILEYFKKKTDPVAEHIRQMLRAIYKPLSKYGKLPNPDGNCDTNEGVIYVWEHIPGVDHWSVLNRFDTNTKVRDKIKELFGEYGHYDYVFTPYGMGTGVKVVSHLTKKELDLSDVDKW